MALFCSSVAMGKREFKPLAAMTPLVKKFRAERGGGG